MQYHIRAEIPADYLQIRALNQDAFARNTEAELVEKLRQEKSYIPGLSLVAVSGQKAIGHLLLSPVQITSNSSDPKESLALAPMAVATGYQKMGIGGALIKAAKIKALQQGYTSIIVLGHPAYYPRYGFKPASHFKIHCPFPVPDEAFMAIELIPEALLDSPGTVIYPSPFMELED
ncbi:MAG: N-acetyltransferase [Saprospiraceae bacterium]|nr:N-acetyltransferase [Saprospiraceae bacterium]